MDVLPEKRSYENINYQEFDDVVSGLEARGFQRSDLLSQSQRTAPLSDTVGGYIDGYTIGLRHYPGQEIMEIEVIGDDTSARLDEIEEGTGLDSKVSQA